MSILYIYLKIYVYLFGIFNLLDNFIRIRKNWFLKKYYIEKLLIFKNFTEEINFF